LGLKQVTRPKFLHEFLPREDFDAIDRAAFRLTADDKVSGKKIFFFKDSQ
jgi:hypothetical protein